jgi:hypothetical protein
MLQATLRHPPWLAELSSNGPNTELQLLSLSGEMSERRPAGRVSSPSRLLDTLLTQMQLLENRLLCHYEQHRNWNRPPSRDRAFSVGSRGRTTAGSPI